MRLPTRAKQIIFFAAAFLAIALARLYPLIKFGGSGLGYDTGFYRRYLELVGGFWKPPAFILGPESLGTRPVLNALAWLKIPTDSALFGSYILFSLLTGLTIYFLAAQIFKNRLAGIFALTLFALSPVQWLAYTFALYKQYWAIWLLLLAFYFLERRRWFFILPLSLALISHRTTALVAAAALGLYVFYIVLNWLKSDFWKHLKSDFNQLAVTLTITAVFTALWLNWQTVKTLIYVIKNNPPQLDIFRLTTGMFINLADYWRLTALTILFGVFGFILLIKKRHFSALFFFTLVTGAIVITKSYFYERVIILLDLALIIFAGGAVAFFYNSLMSRNKGSVIPAPQDAGGIQTRILSTSYIKTASFFSPSYYKRRIGGVNFIFAKIIIMLLILSSATNLFFTIKEYRPLISADELTEIKNLQQTPRNSYIMTFSRDYAPWLYGWGGADNRVISPGLFWDRWNNEQWQEFWNADATRQIDMLAQYREPIYIFNPQYDYSNESCFEKFSEIVWKFRCY